MKLKYYLRGLGIGVIVTTIILAVSLERKPEALTDAQIKERAEELGMVEEKLIKDEKKEDQEAASSGAIKKSTGDSVAAVPESASQAATKATTKAATKETTTTKASTTKATTKASQAPVSEETADGTYITIEIGAYDWSNHVAEKLAAAGLVESAADFDKYLIQHGYESIIASGTHRFKVGSSYEELARELVN